MNGPPWIWWSAAAACLILLHLVHPWRQGFRAGARVFPECQRLWLVPALLAALDKALTAWASGQTAPGAPAGSLAAAGDGVARILTGAFFPESIAGLAALLFLINAGGAAGGLRRGLETVFAGPGTALWIAVLVSAGCSIWLAGLRLLGPIEPLASLLHAASCPWSGVCTAALFTWLLLYAETGLRAPERIAQVEWPVSVAAYTARLWPWALGAALVFAWAKYLDPSAWAWRLAAWAAALLSACAPLVMLHVRTARRFSAGMGMAAERLCSGAGAFAAWLAVAAAWLFLLRFGADRLLAAVAEAWRLPAACLAEFVIAAVSIHLAAVWIAIQVDKFPPATDGPVRVRPASRT